MPNELANELALRSTAATPDDARIARDVDILIASITNEIIDAVLIETQEPAMPKLNFHKFKAMKPGFNCDGALVTDESGKAIGRIEREVEWRDIPGSLSSSCVRNIVTGYVTIAYDETEACETTHKTLGEARTHFRKLAAAKAKAAS